MMRRNTKILLVILLAIGSVQCKTKESLSNYLNASFKNNLDIKTLSGRGRPAIDVTIKNGKALLTVTTEPGERRDTTFYIILDIPAKQKVASVISPVGYIDSRVDINGDSLVCLSAFKPESIHVINIKTSQANEFKVNNSKSVLPGAVLAFDNFILLTNGLYNSAIISRSTGNASMLENEYTTNQQALSFPLNSSVNLVAGKAFGNDSIRLIALDQLGLAKWESKLKILDNLRNNVLPLDIVRIGANFIVRNSSQLQALDAETGKLLWNKSFQPYTTKALLWNDKVILITLVTKGTNKNGFLQQMTLHVIEPATGNVIWSKNCEVTGDVEYVPVNDKLFVASYQSLKVFNFQGEIMTDTALENRNASIEMKLDEITGKSYLLFNKETLYW